MMGIQAGDIVTLYAVVNYTDGQTAEIQIGNTKYFVPVASLNHASDIIWSAFFETSKPENPPDLGVAVGDNTQAQERLS